MRLTVPRLFQLVAMATALALAGCSTQPRLPAVPRHETAEASFLGIPDARFSLTGDPTPLAAMYAAAERRRQMAGATGTEHLLAISGGGEDGAFGAGLLYGWTERGDRPQFRLVTGVSTGALTPRAARPCAVRRGRCAFPAPFAAESRGHPHPDPAP